MTKKDEIEFEASSEDSEEDLEEMADFMPELTVPMGMDKKKSQIIQNLEQKIKKIASQVKSTKAGNVLVE